MLNNRYRQNVKFVSVYFSYHRLCYMISGKFELSREYPDYYKSVSQRLYTILDCATEASTEVRDLNVWTATTREILQTFDFLVSDTDDERTYSLYICDSFLRDFIGRYEIWYRHCYSKRGYPCGDRHLRCTAVRHVFSHGPGPRHSCWLCETVDCQKRESKYMYASHQMNGNFQSDKRNRIVYTISHDELLPGSAVYGPARTKEATAFYAACDIVVAVRCKK